MTPAQWQAVEQSLASPYGRAALTCDGWRITVEVRPTKPLRFELMVFVNGEWRGEWLRADKPCDQQRFMNPRSKAFYTAAQVASLRKVYSAKQLRELAEKKARWFEPTFPTAKAFRRHITKACKEIALVDCTQAEIEARQAKQRALMETVL